MSEYRILHKSDVKMTMGEAIELNMFYPQYKRWGLFWVAIPSFSDYFFKEEDAFNAIDQYKLMKKLKKQTKTRVIAVEDN